jgi:hypothetical protein
MGVLVGCSVADGKASWPAPSPPVPTTPAPDGNPAPTPRPQTCRAARAALHAESADQKVAEAVERRRAGDKLAVPNPIDLINRCGLAGGSIGRMGCGMPAAGGGLHDGRCGGGLG